MKILYIFFGIWLALIASSCNKFVDVVPVTEIDASVMFTDERSATNAVVGIYAKMQETQSFFNGYLSRYAGLYSGELTKTSTTNTTDISFWDSHVQPTDAIISEFWNSGYFYIYSANLAMQKLAGSPTIPAKAKDALMGELRFLRAFVNFYLVNLYGEIPLVMTTNPDSSSLLNRAPQADVYKQIVKDLNEAFKLLPVAYPVSYNAPSDRIRPNRAVAAGFLAKVYLFMRDFSSAEKYSSWVIDSGAYAMETNLENTFLATSKELILGLYPTNTRYNTVEARLFLATPSKPGFIFTSDVIQKFLPNDLRLKQWIKTVGTPPNQVYVPYKYKVYESAQVTEYTVIVRLPELYLIRAEANWNLGEYAKAVEDINLIRARAQTNLLSRITTSDLIRQTIEDEYLREFFAESGNRWFQLRRLPGISDTQKKRADEIIPLIKPGKWEGYKIYWPIPKEEILKSKYITQNPGYTN